MSHSEQLNELSAALSKAQGEMKPAAFDRVNPHFKSKYASLASVQEASRILAKHGLAITQLSENNGDHHSLRTMLLHSSGQWLSSEYPLPTGLKPQELGSLRTYLRRYEWCSIVGIASDDDDDANEAQKAPVPAPVKVEAPKVEAPKVEGEAREIPLGDTPNWVWFGQLMIECAKRPDWADWEEANRGNLETMMEKASKVYKRMIDAIKANAHN